jgi:hypothetical protein
MPMIHESTEVTLLVGHGVLEIRRAAARCAWVKAAQRIPDRQWIPIARLLSMSYLLRPEPPSPCRRFQHSYIDHSVEDSPRAFF